MAERRLYGAVAEFATPDALLEAARRMRENGYTKMDACTPFPVHGIDRALGIPHSRLGYIVFAGGLTGFVAGILLQWWTGAVDYPLLVGGKPLFAFEPSIPIIFELTVLLSAFAAVGGMLALNRLPRLHHPLFELEAFHRVTNDRFFLAVEAADPKFRPDETKALLESLGAESAALVEEEG